ARQPAVDRVDLGVRGEPLGLDRAIHRTPDEAHALRDADRELDLHVVVAGVHVPAGAGPALVRPSLLGVRVDGTDRHPVRVLHHLDLDLGGVAAAARLGGRDLHLASGGGTGLDTPVDALDLEDLAGGDGA